METNHQIRSWADFAFQLHVRFGPSPYNDPNTQLTRHTQTGTVVDYEVNFQRISNKILGLPESFLKGCYIGGLRWDIQREVIGAQPYKLQHTIGLSKLYEGKVGYGRQPNFQLRMYQTTSVIGSRSSPAPLYTPGTYSPNPRNAIVPYSPPVTNDKNIVPNSCTPPTSYHKLPVKRLSLAERQAKIDKGQCYNCDETWHKRHKCKGQMSLLLLEGVIP